MTLLDPRNFQILLLALALEAAFGYPQALFRTLRHPVVWMGLVIERLDAQLNRAADRDGVRRALGAAGLSFLVLLSGALALAIAGGARALPFGWLLEAALAASLLAQRSLHDHVAAVAVALEEGGLAPAREAVAQIVGRDPESLDEAGVARAAIESLAENFSDAVVAPALWCALCGLPGIVVYKAINTADSMLGHLTPRHRAFGWASARLDDLVNLPASRLSAGLLAVATFSLARARQATKIVWRDARKHVSPNAGWPEAAMAGGLAIELGGPRAYHGEVMDGAVIGEGRRELGRADILAALSLYRRALFWLLAGVGLLASLG